MGFLFGMHFTQHKARVWKVRLLSHGHFAIMVLEKACALLETFSNHT